MNKNKGVLIGFIILILIIISLLIIYLFHKKVTIINDNIYVIKEEYQIDKKNNEINMDVSIKNTSKQDQKIDNISVSVKNKDDQNVFFYYKNVDKTLNSGENYDLDISGSIKNSGLKSKKDIKDIKYKLNS